MQRSRSRKRHDRISAPRSDPESNKRDTSHDFLLAYDRGLGEGTGVLLCAKCTHLNCAHRGRSGSGSGLGPEGLGQKARARGSGSGSGFRLPSRRALAIGLITPSPWPALPEGTSRPPFWYLEPASSPPWKAGPRRERVRRHRALNRALRRLGCPGCRYRPRAREGGQKLQSLASQAQVSPMASASGRERASFCVQVARMGAAPIEVADGSRSGLGPKGPPEPVR